MVGVNHNRRSSVGRATLHQLMADAADDGYQLPRREGSDTSPPSPR